jgi:hypothetical protein
VRYTCLSTFPVLACHLLISLNSFPGLTRKEPSLLRTTVPAKFTGWVYQYRSHPGKWSRILSNTVNKGRGNIGEEPASRYATQTVYDPATKLVYVHGGNTGIVSPSGELVPAKPGSGNQDKQVRLDDFWCMSVARCGLHPSSHEYVGINYSKDHRGMNLLDGQNINCADNSKSAMLNIVILLRSVQIQGDV